MEVKRLPPRFLTDCAPPACLPAPVPELLSTMPGSEEPDVFLQIYGYKMIRKRRKKEDQDSGEEDEEEEEEEQQQNMVRKCNWFYPSFSFG